MSVFALILMAAITYANISNPTSDIILYVSIAFLLGSSLVAALCPIFLYKAKYASLNY